MADSDHAPAPDLIDGAALFLDFDGTLVELAETPDSILVPEGLGRLLARLRSRLAGRLAIITGRSIESLERHLDCSAHVVSGSHGAELRFPGADPVRLALPGKLETVISKVERFAVERGLLAERKPGGVALHFRAAPDQAEAVRSLMAGIARDTGLELQLGKMVAELRAPGADKGEALRAIMREPPFAGARPLFMGDDLTDEHGFEAAASLGGGGILIGPPRATAARWRLADVGEAAAWLEQAAGSDHV